MTRWHGHAVTEDMPEPNAPPRVVLDTNVVLSALLFRAGAVRPLCARWQQGALLPVISQAVARELLRVLAYPKFGLTAVERDALLAEYLPWAEVVEMPRLPFAGLPVCRDPHDQPFIELAHVADARYLVSGDADLLALAPAMQALGIVVCTPTTLLARL